ncbi:MAG: valine--tRNA ligase [Clostridia bacterium]|nr:valine--tRNA ligase [Clostridia bacterium]
MKNEIDKIYDPQKIEDKIYQNWLEKKYFHANADKDKKSYTIMMPPPNITGQLHMGHAFDNTLQDILIRFKRMSGYDTLWLPGTDHASIATEAKIVEALAKEGISKDDLGREKFLERAWEWKETYGNKITSQIKKMGSSCDWDRLRFTLDERCSKAVREVFVRLYEKGLIYRGERMVNWCSHCLTSISDAEVEHEEQPTHLWHVKYPLEDNSGELIIATTRPETMLGDTAVAVNPNDERYKNLIGKNLLLPLTDRKVPIIADSYVDTQFGTGAVKITPAHDPNDFEIGLRHNLEIIDVITEDGYLNDKALQFKGMSLIEGRKAVVNELEKQGFLVKTEDYSHNVGTCYRCGTTIEPKISMQWFVKMEPLAKPAIKAVKENDIKFIPEHFDKTYFHWMENIKDWCISRQLWWGHRIPAFYCEDCGKTIVQREDPTECPHCKSKNLKQDEDTLDTWFSSALWPFSTLGWPENTEDFQKYFPTDVLVTGYDIIFFWVARMIFSSLEQTEKIPFHTVFIHGIVRDSQGRKMSKSLGNGIDPLELIEKYGADALRFSLVIGNAPGNDIRYSEDKVLSARNFANKVYNAARFIQMNLDDEKLRPLPKNLQTEDKWLLHGINELAKQVGYNLEHYELGTAVQKIYDFLWTVFCDWYIELSKARINSEDKQVKEDVLSVLVFGLTELLKLLHPVMPFITESLFLSLPHSEESIMIAEYPKFNEDFVFEKEFNDFEKVIDALKAIRSLRTSMNIPNKKNLSLYIKSKDFNIFADASAFFKNLVGVDKIYEGELSENASIITTPDAKLSLDPDEFVDYAAEVKRLEKEKEKYEKEIQFLESKLSNENFVNKAPKQLVEKHQNDLQKTKKQLETLENSLTLSRKKLR